MVIYMTTGGSDLGHRRHAQELALGIALVALMLLIGVTGTPPGLGLAPPDNPSKPTPAPARDSGRWFTW